MSDDSGVRDLIGQLDNRILLEQLDGKLNVIIERLTPVRNDVAVLKEEVEKLKKSYERVRGGMLALKVLWGAMVAVVGVVISLFTLRG